MDAALEERSVRHLSSPRHGLVPGCEVHELPELAEDEAADVSRADLLLDRTEDRLLAVLVVDSDPPAGGVRRPQHLVRLSDR